jgi:hypothetical protein
MSVQMEYDKSTRKLYWATEVCEAETDLSSLDVNTTNSSLVVTGTDIKTITLTDSAGKKVTGTFVDNKGITANTTNSSLVVTGTDTKTITLTDTEGKKVTGTFVDDKGTDTTNSTLTVTGSDTKTITLTDSAGKKVTGTFVDNKASTEGFLKVDGSNTHTGGKVDGYNKGLKVEGVRDSAVHFYSGTNITGDKPYTDYIGFRFIEDFITLGWSNLLKSRNTEEYFIGHSDQISHREALRVNADVKTVNHRQVADCRLEGYAQYKFEWMHWTNTITTTLKDTWVDLYTLPLGCISKSLTVSVPSFKTETVVQNNPQHNVNIGKNGAEGSYTTHLHILSPNDITQSYESSISTRVFNSPSGQKVLQFRVNNVTAPYQWNPTVYCFNGTIGSELGNRIQTQPTESLIGMNLIEEDFSLTDDLKEEIRIPLEDSDYIGIPLKEKGETNGIHR